MPLQKKLKNAFSGRVGGKVDGLSTTSSNPVVNNLGSPLYINAHPVNFAYFTLGSHVPGIRW